MIARERIVRLVGGESPAFERRHGLERFTYPCDQCGAPLTTSEPFALGALRGLVAPDCACGNTSTPYAVVGLFE